MAGFGKFSMENWQVVAVVEIENLQRPRKKITVEYLAWFMENILGSQLRSITVWKTYVRTWEVKYRTHVEAGFEVYAVTGCVIIHPRYLIFVTYSGRT